jgi:hypothetical protein
MEQWREVVGYEGFYEVSDCGRVRSIDRIVQCGVRPMKLKGKQIRHGVGKIGYPVVGLYKNGKGKTCCIHVLVLEAFVGPRPTINHEGCHGDGVRINNVLTNLRWGTSKENRDDSRRHGTLSIGSSRPNAILNAEIVLKIRNDTRPMQTIAHHHGIGLTTVWKVKNRVTWAHVE